MSQSQIKGKARKPIPKTANKSNKRNASARPSSNSSKRGRMEFAPAAKGRVTRMAPPRFDRAKDGSCIVTHREYVRDIAGSVAFANSQFPMNPGMPQLFPWLSQIAVQYEKYRFKKFLVNYETEKATTVSGSLMIAVDFDAADDPPANKQQLMSYKHAERGPVWTETGSRSSVLDMSNFVDYHYVRGGVLASGLDIKTYDVGTLNVATQGCADTSLIGELYVDYVVELSEPQFDPSAIAVMSSERILDSSATRADPFTGGVITGGLGVTSAGATLTFNRVGQYLVEVNYTGTVITDTAPTITGTGTVLGLTLHMHDTAAQNGICLWRITVNNLGETMIFDFTASCTTLTTSVVRIAPYGYSLA